MLEAFAYDAAGRATKTWSTEGVLERVTERTWNILDEATTEYRYVRDTSTNGLSGQSWGRSNRDPAGNETDRCTWAAQPAEWCKQADQTFANPQPTARSSSRYDARNNRIALYVPGQGETTYDPDANYQPAAFYQPTAAGKEHQTRYTYDERHRLASITHVLCATSQRPCSGGNVLASVLASEYAYDGNDNRTTVTDNNGGGAITRHSCYDARNQLVAVSTSSSTCASGVIETYAYDAAGNRTSAAGRSFTYGTSNKLATCSGTACNPVFDADGRLTRVTLASGTWSYQYDAGGRLTAACKASSCTTGIARLDFAYDAEGNRTRITETPASGTATVTELTYEGGRVVRETATTGATVITRAFTADEAGAIVRMTVTGDPLPLHNGTYLVTWSGHGDALALERLDPVTGTLTVANRFSYSTWGTPTLTLHNGYGDLGFRYRYVGQWGVAWDGYAGADLLYMRARHYSPELGRFLQPDPARAEENPYAYAGNSPVSIIDPTGELGFLALLPIARVGLPIVASIAQRAIPWAIRAITAAPTAEKFASRLQHAIARHQWPANIPVTRDLGRLQGLFPNTSKFFPMQQGQWEQLVRRAEHMTITSRSWGVNWGFPPTGWWKIRGYVVFPQPIGYDARTNQLTRYVTYYLDNGTMSFRPGKP